MRVLVTKRAERWVVWGPAAGYWQRADDLMAKLKESGLQADIVTYSTLMSALGVERTGVEK